MKNYIVSESDLKEAIELYFDNRLNNIDKADLVAAIITDLQPVELVAEGWFVHLTDWFKNWHDRYKEKNP